MQGSDVFTVKPKVVGALGPLHLAVRDNAGDEGASQLAEDTLALNLEAGPACCLAVAEPQPIECGLQAVLPQLRVLVVDAHGNPTTSVSCEVSEVPSACCRGRQILSCPVWILCFDCREALDGCGPRASR